MSSSAEEYAKLRQQQPLSTFEHVGLLNEFVVDPRFLVVLIAEGHQPKIFGLFYMDVEALKDAILFRATELLACSMVDPKLQTCKARLVSRDGEAWFHYNTDNYRYEVTKKL